MSHSKKTNPIQRAFFWNILPAARCGPGIKALAAASVIFSVSCAAPSVSEQAVAKSFNPPKGKSLIYVYRPSRPFTGLIGRPVFIDKQLVGSTRPGSFAAISVNPGTHAIQAGALALFDSADYHRAYQDIIVNLRAGQCVFIKQTINPATAGPQSFMMLQTGGAPVPIPMGGGFPPFGAVVMDQATGRSQCEALKQVATEAYVAQ